VGGRIALTRAAQPNCTTAGCDQMGGHVLPALRLFGSAFHARSADQRIDGVKEHRRMEQVTPPQLILAADRG
jgi:hypothetical protein